MINIFDKKIETVSEIALKASPPTAVSTAPLLGIDVPSIIQYATLLYIVLVVIDKIWIMYKRWKGRNNEPIE